MKLLFFTPYYPPQGEAAATRAYWFNKVLKEAGHEVKLLNGSEFNLRPASNKERAIVRLLKENLTGIELFFRVITSRNDIIILSSPPFFTILWGVFGALASGQKFILDIRDLYPEIFFELGMIKKGSIFGRIASHLTKMMYCRASNIMTVTQGLCREIESYGGKKPLLVMNGFDNEIFSPSGFEEKFPKFTAVFHGTMGKIQNIDTFLSLAKDLKDEDIDFIVAGEGSKIDLIINANLPNVKYLGNIPYSKVPSLLRKCHVGLSFRNDDKIGKEAFPVKVFEYIGSGLPVIMTPPGEAGAVLIQNGFGYEFENSQVKDMGQRIRNIKNNGYTRPDNSRAEAFSRREQAKMLLQIVS